MRLTRAALVLAVVVCMGCGDYEMTPRRGRSAAPEAVGVVVDPFAPAPPAGGKASEAPPAGDTKHQGASPSGEVVQDGDSSRMSLRPGQDRGLALAEIPGLDQRRYGWRGDDPEPQLRIE